MAEDLNGMRTLALLFETRSVTATAERLSVSQPAVSYALARLRRRFSDDLFRREGHALVPTAVAEQLYDMVGPAVRQIDEAAANLSDFHPGLLRSEMVMSLSSLGETSLLPVLAREVRQQAPNAKLRVVPLAVESVEDQLLRGDVDAAITMSVLRSLRIERHPLFTEEYVAVTARGVTLTAPNDLRRHKFIEVRGGGHQLLVDSLYEHGLADQVEVIVEAHASVPYLLENSELVALLPQHYAEMVCHRHALEIHSLPWNIHTPPVALYTRPETGLSVMQRWMRDLIVATLRSGNSVT